MLSRPTIPVLCLYTCRLWTHGHESLLCNVQWLANESLLHKCEMLQKTVAPVPVCMIGTFSHTAVSLSRGNTCIQPQVSLHDGWLSVAQAYDRFQWGQIVLCVAGSSLVQDTAQHELFPVCQRITQLTFTECLSDRRSTGNPRVIAHILGE